MRETRIPCLRGVRNYFAYNRLRGSRTRGKLASFASLGFENYLNNYLTMYIRLMRSRICVKLASPAYLVLGIIYIINLLINT